MDSKSKGKAQHRRSSTTMSGQKTAVKSAASKKNSNALATPSTQAGLTANKNSHGQEYLGSGQVPWGGVGTPMDPRMYKSNQAPEIQNFQEPKYVKNSNLTASNSTKFQTPARGMTQSQMLKTVSVQPERDSKGQLIDPIGPGAYDVERSLEFTKPRNPSPDLGHQVERQSPARLDSISPDQYEPKKDFVLPQSPIWTIGPKHGPLLGAEDEDMVNMGAAPYESSAGQPAVGYSFANQKDSDKLIPATATSKARPKSTLNSRGRGPTNAGRAQKRGRGGAPEFAELDSYNEPQKFGSTAKGVATFGAPKLSAATQKSSRLQSRRSTAQQSRTTAPTRHQRGSANPDGMSMMTQVVFEEEAGPGIQEEQVSKTRDVTRDKATKSAKPSLSAQATPKKVQLKSNFNGKASKKRVPQTGMGPGQYNPDAAQNQTHARSRTALIGTKTGRPDINKRVQSGTGDLGPGAYDDGKDFGKNVRGHSFGKPKPEVPVYDDRDYGTEPEKAFNNTRCRSPSAVISKGTPARPASWANPAQADSAGPGQYNSGKNFGEGVKGHGFGKPRPEKTEVDERDYGQDAEQEFKHTRAKSPAAIINKHTPARPSSFALQQETGGPGQYDSGKEFGKGVRNMTFEKTARTKPIEETTGPGQYDAERAASVTKARPKSAYIGKEKARPESFAPKGQLETGGPGQYDAGTKFGDNVKGHGFGAPKTPKKVVDNRDYNTSPERDIRKPRTPAATFSKTQARPATLATNVDVVGPGQYDDGKRFNSNVKSFRIGEKRPEKRPESMGPGAYSPEKADAITKSKMPNITMGSSPSRPVVKRDLDVAPGQYDDGKRFNSNVKSFRIGEKRPERVVEGVGPGAYEPDRADGQTKPKMPNITMGGSPSRPQSFAKKGDFDVAPGQYDDGIKFNTGVKGFKIAEKRPERIVETMGPGAYEPDRADGQTKPKMPNINMGSTPSRPASFAKGGDVDVAPGQYDDGIRFNSGVKGFKIAEKREPRLAETMGPGAYDPDKADGQTKPKMPNITMGGSPSRPQSFAKGGDVDVAPGQYDDGIRFNSGVKGFKIAEKREHRTIETMGPGAYDPDKADGMTKPKIPNINMGSTPSRPASFAKSGDVDVAPGQYDDGREFGKDVKTFTIPQKREHRIPETMGPGAYDPDRADGQTKPKMPNITMGGSPSRPQSFAKGGDVDVAPGQYDDGIRFNSGVKGFKIAEKREQRAVETMGPGAYDPDRADGQTKPKMPNITMGGSPSRPQSFAKGGDVDVAPGQYDDGITFNTGVKGFKIGEKREQRTVETMGPGAYDPDRADGQTKTKIPNINMGSTPSRPASFAKGGDVDVAPGQYDDGITFNTGVKGFKIGEKREPRTVETMGPGAYDPDRADGQTKPKMPNINLGSSPSRPQSFAKGGDVDVAPGQYDDGIRFNSDVKGFKISEKREQRIVETMGPGAYDPDRANGLTQPKIPNINMGTTPSRPASFAKSGDVDVAPGQYDDGREFGKDVKSFTIPEKREHRIPESMGPGAYDPDRADGQIKPKIPNINMGSTPSRPDSFAKGGDIDVAPGQYDDGKGFGKDAKTFTIPEKREQRIPETMGPGAYDPDRADGQTKPKVPNINMGSTPSRPASFAKPQDVDVAPGQYDDGREFGKGAPSFKIPEKREQRVPETMGPGAYDPDRADGQTRPKAPAVNLNSSPERPGLFNRPQDEASIAPGQYDDGSHKFGKDVRGFTIGEKRDKPIAETMGPGAYDPDKADKMTRPKSPTVNLGQSPSRPDTLAHNPDNGHLAPGTYDDNSYKFGKNVKPSFTIGEKREARQPEGVGPGAYDPERADEMTKPKVPNINLGSSPGRPDRVGQTSVPASTNERRNTPPAEIQPAQKKRPEPVRTTEPYKSLKPKDSTASKLMEPVRKNTRQTEDSGRQTKKASGRRASQTQVSKQVTRQGTRTMMQEETKTLTLTKQVTSVTTSTKVVNGKVVSSEVDVKQSRDTNVKKSTSVAKKSSNMAVSSQKSTNRQASNRKTAPKRTGRESAVKTSSAADENPGPGSHDPKGLGFGENLNNITIGSKRPDRLNASPGPGEYDTGRADSQTKNRSPTAVDFDKRTGRAESPAKFDGPEPESLPRFYNWPKELPIYTIGEKRPEKPKEGPGPGEYNLDDSATKPRTTGMHQF